MEIKPVTRSAARKKRNKDDDEKKTDNKAYIYSILVAPG
jgi:hypothetical protein